MRDVGGGRAASIELTFTAIPSLLSGRYTINDVAIEGVFANVVEVIQYLQEVRTTNGMQWTVPLKYVYTKQGRILPMPDPPPK